MEVFKIFRGFDNININNFATTDLISTTRKKGFNVIGKRIWSNEVKHFSSIESCIFGSFYQHK